MMMTTMTGLIAEPTARKLKVEYDDDDEARHPIEQEVTQTLRGATERNGGDKSSDHVPACATRDRGLRVEGLVWNIFPHIAV